MAWDGMNSPSAGGKKGCSYAFFKMKPTTVRTSEWSWLVEQRAGQEKRSERPTASSKFQRRVLNCRLRDLTASTPEYTTNMCSRRWMRRRPRPRPRPEVEQEERNRIRNGSWGSNRIRRVSDRPTSSASASHRICVRRARARRRPFGK